MKRLFIVVEGQTEQKFVSNLLAPYLFERFAISAVTPVVIRTSKTGRGGFVNYQHLKRDINRLLSSDKDDFVVSMFVDYFRCPTNFPGYADKAWSDSKSHAHYMENRCAADIGDSRFVPYIQMHEFEALLFSSNEAFEEYWEQKDSLKTAKIISDFPNPEEINHQRNTSPSNRILGIRPDYDKVNDGVIFALTIGIERILTCCERFKRWVELLTDKCKDL